MRLLFFFFNDTATTEIYTLSLHDALPISTPLQCPTARFDPKDLLIFSTLITAPLQNTYTDRSEEHTSELQSRLHLVCRLLLEKKKNTASKSKSLSALLARQLGTNAITIYT